MIPSQRLVWLVFAILIASLGAAFFPGWMPDWQPLTGALLGVLLFDALSLTGKKNLQMERKLMHALSLGVWSDVELTVHNHYRRPLAVEVFDHHPQSLRQRGLPVRITIPVSNWAKIHYQVMPTRRGPARFSQVQLRIGSLLGFWRKEPCAAVALGNKGLSQLRQCHEIHAARDGPAA
jgi:uncharacterized protein (DUF58 family)